MVKITVAQIKPKLGDLEYNARKILEVYAKAKGDIVLFPEACLTGYLPRDGLLCTQFLANCHVALVALAAQIGERVCLIGMPFLQRGRLFNAMLALQNGRVIAKSFKSHLPNYGVFDEKRYFAAGKPAIFEHKGVKFGLPVCEDIWHGDICQKLHRDGVEALLIANASPYEQGKREARLAEVRARFGEVGLPLVYCNQVLGQDGIIYDGTSFAFDGKNTVFAPSFRESLLELELTPKGKIKGSSTEPASEMESLYEALVFGLREYVLNSGFKKVVLGLSGGADSALVLVLAVKALGKANVQAVLMPSRFTSKESLRDARALAANLGITLQEVEIEPMLQPFVAHLELGGLAFENLQARVRANILMAISNKEGALVLTTGNKSELAVGYCTIYGDMCGAYNPIKDLYKTEVFELMRHINRTKIAKIPQNIITKAPSAELRENQKDSDSLPEYEVLDALLREFIENQKLPEEVVGFSPQIVAKVWRLLQVSEYKRRQAAPGTKVSPMSFEAAEWRRNIT